MYRAMNNRGFSAFQRATRYRVVVLTSFRN